MSYLKILALCSVVLCVITKTEATLAQSSNKFSYDEVVNTFSKDVDKKDNGMTASSSEAPASSTISPHDKSNQRISLVSVVHSGKNSKQSVSLQHHAAVSESGKPIDNDPPVNMNGGANHQKAIWVTLLICLNVLLMFVIALGLKTGYNCYRKFNETQGNTSPTSAGAVHFTTGGNEPRIFTVMPGHLVLQIPHGGIQQQQQQHSSSPAAAVEDTSNSSVGTPDTVLMTPCGSSSIRSESPPPPYVSLYPQLKDY